MFWSVSSTSPNGSVNVNKPSIIKLTRHGHGQNSSDYAIKRWSFLQIRVLLLLMLLFTLPNFLKIWRSTAEEHRQCKSRLYSCIRFLKPQTAQHVYLSLVKLFHSWLQGLALQFQWVSFCLQNSKMGRGEMQGQHDKWNSLNYLYT